MSLTLTGNSALTKQVLEIRNRIIYDFYPELPHMISGLFGYQDIFETPIELGLINVTLSPYQLIDRQQL